MTSRREFVQGVLGGLAFGFLGSLADRAQAGESAQPPNPETRLWRPLDPSGISALRKGDRADAD